MPSFVSFTFFILKSVLSDKSIANPSFFFHFHFAWNIFFSPFASNPYVSLSLMWVSCKQHIYGSLKEIHSPYVFWSIWKVIIDSYVLIVILFLMPFFSTVFRFLSFNFCVSCRLLVCDYHEVHTLYGYSSLV